MDGVNTYNCQCPPEWTGMKTALYTVCVCLLSLVPFSASGDASQILIQEQFLEFVIFNDSDKSFQSSV